MISAIEAAGLIGIMACVLGVLCVLLVRKNDRKELNVECAKLIITQKGRHVYIRSEDRLLKAHYVFSCIEAADYFYTDVCKYDEINERSEEEQ